MDKENTNGFFKFPIKVVEVSQDDLVIEDASGNVVVRLNWLGDAEHLRKQKKVGDYIVSALTNCFDSVPVPAGVVEGVSADNFCGVQEVKKPFDRGAHMARMRAVRSERRKHEKETKT